MPSDELLVKTSLQFPVLAPKQRGRKKKRRYVGARERAIASKRKKYSVLKPGYLRAGGGGIVSSRVDSE